ncbi:MarR family transcriptional regulator [Methylopila sp. M107]|uniref:MarR family transcriptional regulator n=1 Tax=Methylopila sp. M107 TaxID=1101190 RepID=UPI0003625146|nr:MarR family transcriptional regulator [Methylopila sp. M107]
MPDVVDQTSATEFGRQLALLSRRWRKRLDDALASSGLTDASWRPLIHLGRLGDGARQSDLARALGIEGPSLVRLLDRLEASKLIERREDSSDRRAKTLHLTPEGETLVDRMQAVVGDTCGALVEGVSSEELATCARVFARLIDRTEPEGRT